MSSEKAKKFSIKEDLQFVERLDKHVGADPMKLWEAYREQSLMWRALALLLLPGTLLAVTMAFTTFFWSDTRIEVPPAPEPGFYKVDNIPDRVFLQKARRLTTLISSYQPVTAKNQFSEARKMLWEPILSRFQKEYVKDEFKNIKRTNRSQMFYINTKGLQITRFDDHVIVRIAGKRKKFLGKELSKLDDIAWFVTMSTVPPNALNRYGIVVTNFKLVEGLEEVERETQKIISQKDGVA